MAVTKTTQNALRASLKHEDAALAERLPEVATITPTPEAPTPDSPMPVKPAGRTTKPRKAPTARPTTRARSTTATPAPVDAKPPAPVPEPAAPPAKVAKKSNEASYRTDEPNKPLVVAAKPKRSDDEPKKKARTSTNATKEIKSAKLKPEKAVKDTFSMLPGEHAQLKTLRKTLRGIGHSVTRSDLLRAGLALIGELSTPALVAHLDHLPPTKSKRKK